MNPPFKGTVDKDDVSETLPGNTTKSELLFVHLILRALDMGGRCAVIVPDGVLFGSSRAHVELRQEAGRGEPAGRRGLDARRRGHHPRPVVQRSNPLC